MLILGKRHASPYCSELNFSQRSAEATVRSTKHRGIVGPGNWKDHKYWPRWFSVWSPSTFSSGFFPCSPIVPVSPLKASKTLAAPCLHPVFQWDSVRNGFQTFGLSVEGRGELTWDPSLGLSFLMIPLIGLPYKTAFPPPYGRSRLQGKITGFLLVICLLWNIVVKVCGLWKQTAVFGASLCYCPSVWSRQYI